MWILIHFNFRNIISVQSVQSFSCSMEGGQSLIQNSISLFLFIQSLIGFFGYHFLLLLNNELGLTSLLPINLELFEKHILFDSFFLQGGLQLD